MTTIALLDGPLCTGDTPKSYYAPAEIHARAVVAAIHSIDPAVEILSFPVFEQKLTCTRSKVVSALERAMQSQAQILHCSFGFPTADSETASAFKKAVQHFVCVVASSPARGNPVYPANYTGVLKASGDARITGKQWSWLNTATVDFAASAVAPEGYQIGGASIGAARISAVVARLLKQSGRASSVYQKLRTSAVFTGPEVRTAIR